MRDRRGRRRHGRARSRAAGGPPASPSATRASPVAVLAAGFHEAIGRAGGDGWRPRSRGQRGIDAVVLTGGVFQNAPPHRGRRKAHSSTDGLPGARARAGPAERRRHQHRPSRDRRRPRDVDRPASGRARNGRRRAAAHAPADARRGGPPRGCQGRARRNLARGAGSSPSFIACTAGRVPMPMPVPVPVSTPRGDDARSRCRAAPCRGRSRCRCRRRGRRRVPEPMPVSVPMPPASPCSTRRPSWPAWSRSVTAASAPAVIAAGFHEAIGRASAALGRRRWPWRGASTRSPSPGASFQNLAADRDRGVRADRGRSRRPRPPAGAAQRRRHQRGPGRPSPPSPPDPEAP